MRFGAEIWTLAPWPYRPQPLSDELLSSYLIRTAHGLSMRPVTFTNAVWGSRDLLFGQDIDNYAPAAVIDRIATGTGLAPHAILGMTFSPWRDDLDIGERSISRKPWILPVSIVSNDRRRPGLQFCPACFASDPRPYLRRTWRLAFATVCTIHKVEFCDRCPHCRSTLQPHRSPSLRTCYSCGGDLAGAGNQASRRLVTQTRAFEQTLRDGWTDFAGKPIYAYLYFRIVRQIAALLVNGKRAEKLRQAAAAALGGDDVPFNKPNARQPVEYLHVVERRRLFDLVARLLEDFPERFVGICAQAGVWRSHIVKDMGDVPFELDEALCALDRTPYYPTDAEVRAAAEYLRRVKGIATYRELKALCSESRAAIYKYMDYEREQTSPSKRRLEALKILHSQK